MAIWKLVSTIGDGCESRVTRERQQSFGGEWSHGSFINLGLTLIRKSSRDGVDETSDAEWKYEVRRVERQNVPTEINHNGRMGIA